MKGMLTKMAALFMCFVLVTGLSACNHGYGEDLPLEGEIDMDGKTVNLVDTAWASEEADSKPGKMADLSHISDQVKDISMDLFRASVTEGENSMISPVSILMAMAMVENGAAGESLAQMEEAFGCSVEELSAWLGTWRDVLQTSEDTNVNVANSFWFRDNEALDVKEDYLRTISGLLDAQAYKSAFSQGTVDDMNKWCDENTYGMIKEIIQSLNPQDMAVLLNATAFEGVWETPYEEFQVREDEVFYREDGTSEKAAMMYSRESIYIEGSNMTGFMKPYKDGYSFMALLPDEGVSVADCVKELDGETLRSLLDGARTEKVNAVIPEFTSAYRVDNLVQTFAEMGMTDIFSPVDSDLSAMAELEGGQPLFVSGIVHKTFIEVNRAGTRAAAVTGIKVGATADMIEKIYNVRLDRPFIYAIIDDATQTPMFVGTTMSVAAEE